MQNAWKVWIINIIPIMFQYMFGMIFIQFKYLLQGNLITKSILYMELFSMNYICIIFVCMFSSFLFKLINFIPGIASRGK